MDLVVGALVCTMVSPGTFVEVCHQYSDLPWEAHLHAPVVLLPLLFALHFARLVGSAQ